MHLDLKHDRIYKMNDMAVQQNFGILMIDLVEDFFVKGFSSEGRARIITNTNELTKVARGKNIPIIWVKQEFKADLSDAYIGLRKNNIQVTIENTPGSQFLDGLNILETDYKIIKKRFSAFFNTDLNKLLKVLVINTLIIGGVKTHACIRTTVIDAYQEDYEVVIASDCLGDSEPEHAEISLKYLTKYIASIKTNEELIKIL